MDDRLQSRMVRLRPAAIGYQGVVFRSTSPAYANESDLLTGEGSRITGGRWNPRGIAVVYASLGPETALAETLAHNRYYGIPDDHTMPRTFVAIDVKLTVVLDLRAGSIRQRLKVAAARMLDIDWRSQMQRGREPITQAIGRTASQAGWEGLLVPSAADRQGSNLLVFPQNRRKQSALRVLNVDRLGG